MLSKFKVCVIIQKIVIVVLLSIILNVLIKIIKIIIFISLKRNYRYRYHNHRRNIFSICTLFIEKTTINYKQFDDITMSTRQNIRNIIFIIISCCFIYAILSSLYLHQRRIFDKNEFLFINEFLSIICLVYYLFYLFS